MVKIEKWSDINDKGYVNLLTYLWPTAIETANFNYFLGVFGMDERLNFWRKHFVQIILSIPKLGLSDIKDDIKGSRS